MEFPFSSRQQRLETRPDLPRKTFFPLTGYLASICIHPERIPSLEAKVNSLPLPVSILAQPCLTMALQHLETMLGYRVERRYVGYPSATPISSYVSKFVTFIALNFIVQCSKSVLIYIKGSMWLSSTIAFTLVPRRLITISAPHVSISCIGSTIYSLLSIIIARVTQVKEKSLVPGYRRPYNWFKSF